MKKRIHLFYSGAVQGVGFRYMTRRCARRCALKGWVKNLPDGRVEVLAEGDEKDLHTFIGEMEQGPLGRDISSAEKM